MKQKSLLKAEKTEILTGESDPHKSSRPTVVAPRWFKFILLLFGIILALIVGEAISRWPSPNPHDPFAHNPIIRSQSNQVELFESDSTFGHRLKGGDFVGVYAPGLVSFDQLVDESRRRRGVAVLNMGDSSTSGWDSNVIAKNADIVKRGEKAKSPFQIYKTYSDIMADTPNYYVINAGVPGFSSLQGSRYLQSLLSRFEAKGVRIDAVTLYFGNNDSVFNGNTQDKYKLPGNAWEFHLPSLWDRASASYRVVTRVEASEYRRYLGEMIHTCREKGVQVFLIEPVIPRIWQPGKRADGLESEVDRMLEEMKNNKAGKLLMQAQEIYKRGMEAFERGDQDQARLLLEQAREEDFLVPRIKYSHVQVLRAVAAREGVRLVSVKERIPVNDSGYFRDYCHPDEVTNRLLAGELAALLREVQPKHPWQ